MISYFIEVILIQFFFILLYDVLFRRMTFFTGNRIFLLGSFILSWFLPFITVRPFFESEVLPEAGIIAARGINRLDEVILQTGSSEAFSTQQSLVLVWIVGSVLFAVLLIAKVRQLHSLYRKGNRFYKNQYTLIELPGSKDAFSFLNWVFMGDAHGEAHRTSILEHEMIHIRQKHSLDLILMELSRVWVWFNPLVYLYQNRLTEVHEYLADRNAIKKQGTAYFGDLLNQVFSTRNISFVNPFFKYSLIKKRIVMLKRKPTHRKQILKYTAVLPLLFGIILYTSCDIDRSFIEGNEVQAELMDYMVDEENISLEQVQANISDSDLDTAEKERLLKEAELFFEQQMISSLAKREESQPLKMKDSDGVPFATVDRAPIFPGCEDESDSHACFKQQMIRHIQKHFNYPEEAQEQGIQGRVAVMFYIQEDGTLGDIFTRGPSPILEAEVRRIISRLPQMKPGMNDGKPVSVPFSIPISFKLN